MQDLLDYMDSLNELVCLVLDGKTGAFVPQTRDFLKKRVSVCGWMLFVDFVSGFMLVYAD